MSSNALTDTENDGASSTSYHTNIQNTQVSYLTNDATNTPSISPLVNDNEQHLSKQNIFILTIIL